MTGKIIGWGVAAAAAIAAAYLVLRGKGEPDNLCLADLPAPFKAQAAEIVAKGDVGRMESFAQQADLKGWHCAAKELRAEAKKVKAKETKAHSEMSLPEVASSAPEEVLRIAVKKALDLFEKPKIGGAEGPDYSKIGFVRSPTDEDEKMLRDLADALSSAGYVAAAKQAADAADSARDAIAAARRESSCEGIFEKLPASPLRFTKLPAKDSILNVRSWVQEMYAKGSTDAKNFVAAVLDDEAASMMGAESADVGPGIYWEAAKCLRGERS